MMKKNSLIKQFKTILSGTLVLMIILSLAPLMFGCSEKPVEIEDIVLSKNVDINGNPTEATDKFPSGTQEIFLVIKIKNMKTTDNLTVRWTFLDENIEIDSKTFVPEKNFSGNHVFKIKIAQGFPFGNYEASAFLNGKQIKNIPFKVE